MGKKLFGWFAEADGEDPKILMIDAGDVPPVGEWFPTYREAKRHLLENATADKDVAARSYQDALKSATEAKARALQHRDMAIKSRQRLLKIRSIRKPDKDAGGE